MKTPRGNRALTAGEQKTSGKCSVCKGRKQVDGPKGKVVCYACRGTGESHGGKYQTK